MDIFNKNLRFIFLLIFLAEILSFLGYYYQLINFIAFFAIIILVLILSLHRLEYGLYILLTELLIGSFGYLFYFENHGFKISIRMALWLIIMSVWLARTIFSWLKTKQLNINFFKSPYFNYFFILFVFIAWGAVNGLLKHNSFGNLFLDFDRWAYFMLIFPVFQVVSGEANLKIVKQIFLSAISWLSLKTLLLAYFFSHSFNYFTLDFYRWVRLSGAGEITQVVPGFSRVFMQSHIFVLIGFFILLFYLLKLIINQNANNKKFIIACILPLSLLLAAIIISFSRSFWIGLAAGGLSVWLIAIFKLKIKLKRFLIFNLYILAVAILSLILAAAVIKFPYPSPAGGFNAANLFEDRATAVAGEAGASSRWQLLPPLWQKIKIAPLLGRGYGATITYKSSDPRILAANAKGEYTTYAFEWGWLDVWLKLGLLGLLAYLILFIKIIRAGLKNNCYLPLSLITGLIVLAAVNITSPYVNHPLGIGYLMIAAAMIDSCTNSKLPVY